jgi:hypothetical protein
MWLGSCVTTIKGTMWLGSCVTTIQGTMWPGSCVTTIQGTMWLGPCVTRTSSYCKCLRYENALAFSMTILLLTEIRTNFQHTTGWSGLKFSAFRLVRAVRHSTCLNLTGQSHSQSCTSTVHCRKLQTAFQGQDIDIWENRGLVFANKPLFYRGSFVIETKLLLCFQAIHVRLKFLKIQLRNILQ